MVVSIRICFFAFSFGNGCLEYGESHVLQRDMISGRKIGGHMMPFLHASRVPKEWPKNLTKKRLINDLPFFIRLHQNEISQ